MKKNRNKQLYILTIVIASILSLTVVYAALSTTLSISGNASINNSSWNVVLKKHVDTSNLLYAVTGSAVSTTPTLTGTDMNYSVTLKKPGDSVTYNVTFFNEGTINGELTSVNHGTPTCTSSTGNKADEELVCNNLEYSIVHKDGTALQPGVVVAPYSNDYSFVCINGSSTDKHSGSSGHSLLLKITFSENATEVPSSAVTITNLKTEFNFVQTDKICKTSGGINPPA